ncbi:MAG: DUF423 domain-containing protein [Hyphomonadaceae bacterium]|nr:DUF423 domain-containing protein [Hyphomonadaceae bacterium]
MSLLVSASASLGFIGVALGAFGAHALDGKLSPEAEGWWQTATLYVLVHTVGALAVGLSGRSGLLAWGGWSLILGALVFSGTLYAMALGAPRWFGAITPLGGIAFLMGWALIGLGGFRASS